MCISMARSRYAMTSTAAERVAIIGTGLIGTSIAMASVRVGCEVSGWDPDEGTLTLAAERGSIRVATSLEDAVAHADIVIICAPVPFIPGLAARVLEVATDAIVTDAGSIKDPVVREVAALAGTASSRFVGGHPMGGSERSGPDHSSASLVDGIVWVLTPGEEVEADTVVALEAWVDRIGGRPVRMSPGRHDRLVAFVSHLPQIASTALMGLAATEEADEPDILLLAAGGFRDLTRLASSNPALWSQILLSNREAIAEAIDLYAARLADLRAMVVEGRGADVEETFDDAKRARLRLAAKPQVRAGVAVLQVQAPDRPGALAELTSVLAQHSVNIEDLQIVHSPEGGRGIVHLTVAATSADDALRVLASRSFDPIRLA
jgi:prephenate dehydrogenase